jgi:Predicted AAA-ATPase
MAKATIEKSSWAIISTKIEPNGGSFLLFLRPRRFGKSLTTSMLRYFIFVSKKRLSKKLG